MQDVPTDLELMNIHVRASYTHNAEGRILFVNEPDNNTIPAPRLFLGRTRDGNVWRFRADQPDDLCARLNEFCAEEPPLTDELHNPLHLESYMSLLEQHGTAQCISKGLAYRFTRDGAETPSVVAVTEENVGVLRGGFEELIGEVPTWQPFVARVLTNRAVSVCRSSRITVEAHEAGVETLQEFRGNGFAKDVVSEWARLVRGTGSIPLYSTSWENASSQAVARKLGLKCYGVTANFV